MFDFINLTQVHNFTVSAQDIFTFRRLSVFTVRFTGILEVVMQIMFCTVLLTSQVVMIKSLQPKGREFESTCVLFLPLFISFINSFFIDVPQSLRNEILDHSMFKG